jgi:hypothetical protein
VRRIGKHHFLIIRLLAAADRSDAVRHACRLLRERGAFRLGSRDGRADCRFQAPAYTSRQVTPQ